jgi:hypothetical protein
LCRKKQSSRQIALFLTKSPHPHRCPSHRPRQPVTRRQIRNHRKHTCTHTATAAVDRLWVISAAAVLAFPAELSHCRNNIGAGIRGVCVRFATSNAAGVGRGRLVGCGDLAEAQLGGRCWACCPGDHGAHRRGVGEACRYVVSASCMPLSWQ